MELENICKYKNDRVSLEELSSDNYVSTENMIPNKGGVCCSSNLPQYGNAIQYSKGDILISNIRPYFKKIWYADKEGGCSADVLCFKAKENVDTKYLYYLLSQQEFFDYVMAGCKGCKMPRGDKQHIMQWDIQIPKNKDDQRRIANILSSIDSKIELNRLINHNLEQQAQALFNCYFVENTQELGNYEIGNLTDIASYLNGLAMQNYRPNDKKEAIPVIKIKELGQGFCNSNSDTCSLSIKSEYIVNDGDFIFSWSGTLMTDIWTGGKCGLNQHLFKVTSKKYPKWYVYFWTNYHLDKFIRIAKDKAVTMGHIKRAELVSSEVLIPNTEILDKLNEIFAPLFNENISRRLEIRKLSLLRESLLPKLMSGELKINNLNS